MARIRSIKPEFFAHELLAKVSRDARLLFVGLWTVSDDEGRLRGSPVFIHGQVFPYDEDLDIRALLTELENQTFIQRYEVDGQKFIFIPGFNRQQKIDHPTKSRLPAPPDVSRETLAIDSRNFREALAPDLGVEGKGVEGKGVAPSAVFAASAPVADRPDQVELPACAPSAPPDAAPEPDDKPTPAQKATRQAVKSAFEAKHAQANTGVPFPWSAKENKHVKLIATACGDDAQRALTALRAALAEPYLATRFIPSMVSPQIAALLQRNGAAPPERPPRPAFARPNAPIPPDSREAHLADAAELAAIRARRNA